MLRNKSKIQSEINQLQTIKDKLIKAWTQSSSSDLKLMIDDKIRKINKKIDKLDKKLK